MRVGVLFVSYLPTYFKTNPNVCPKMIHVVESVRKPLIAVIEPFGTSVFSTAFVFVMTEKHSREFTINESMRNYQ